MANSPQRLLFLGIILCLLLGLGLDLLSVQLPTYSNFFPSDDLLNKEGPLSAARYAWRLGQFEKAIEEYQQAIPDLPEEESGPAYKELERLIRLDQSTSGRMVGQLAYYAWSLPPRLYFLAGLFLTIWLVLLVYRYTKKTPKFVIQPFSDRAGLDLGNDLPKIAIDRIHELVWRSQNLEGISSLIAENIEIPALSLMSEGDNQKATELLEIALLFSLGTTGLPFANIISAVRLWLEQPHFLVRGVIDKQEDVIVLKMSLVDRKANRVVKIWHIEIPSKEGLRIPRVVDAVIYPLLFHFNKMSAARWEALQALHMGFEEFQLFRENQSAPAHLELAQQQLEQAILLDPGYDLARYNLSLLLLATGEFEKSKDYLRELSSLSADPQLRLRAKYNYGIALFHVSQDWAYEQAAKVFRELLAQEESRPLELLIHSALSMTYAKMACRLKKERGELINEALLAAERVTGTLATTRDQKEKNLPSSEEALANAIAAKGFAYMASKDYGRAIDYFKEALNVNPGNISYLLGLGEAYSLNNLKEEALDIFRRTAIQSPLSGYTNYRLGNLYREFGKLEEAIRVLKRAPRYAQARLTLGKIHLDCEDFEEALEEFRQAVQLNSHLSEGWVNIAWTILQMDRLTLLKEALKAARQARQLEKNENQLWHRQAILAFCLYQSKQNERALSEAKKAVELGEKQPQAHYYLALTQERAGQHANARKSAEKVIALDKKGTWAAKAAQLLNQLP